MMNVIKNIVQIHLSKYGARSDGKKFAHRIFIKHCGNGCIFNLHADHFSNEIIHLNVIAKTEIAWRKR